MRSHYVKGRQGHVNSAKFMQSLDNVVFQDLGAAAKARGITLQQFIRAVIIPDWVQSKGLKSEAMMEEHLLLRRARLRILRQKNAKNQG